jgi:hypothetical protein
MISMSGSRWKGAATLVTVSGIAFTIATSGALAQDDAVVATPAAESSVENATPPAIAANGAGAFDKAQLTESIQQLTDVIAVVQKDRDSVANTIDLTEIDALLAKATELRDSAKATLQTDDVSTAPQAIFTGLQSAGAAHGLIKAGVEAYGLPSQQAHASRVLVQAYYAIDEITSGLKPDADANATFFAETAKRLYSNAFELYNAGTYTQAEQTAAVAQQVATIGSPEFEIATSGCAEPGVIVVDGENLKPETSVGVPEARVPPGDNPNGAFQEGQLPANVEVVLPPKQGGNPSGSVNGPRVDVYPGTRDGGIPAPYPGVFTVNGPSFSSGTVFSLSGLDGSDTPLEVPAPNFD